MKRVGILYIVLVCVLAFNYYPMDKYRIIKHSNEPNLPTNLTKSIMQDTDGYIWIATDAGLVRYDGRNYVHFKDGFASNYIKQIELISDSILIVVSDMGIYRMIKEGYSDHYPIVLIPGAENKTDSTVHHPKIVYQDKDSVLWIGEPNAVVSYKDGKLKRYQFGESYRADSYNRGFYIIEDDNNNLIISSQKGHILKLNRKTDEFEFIGKLGDNSFRLNAFVKSDNGKLLAGSISGLFELSINYSSKKINSKLLANIESVSSVVQDNNGNIYLGTWNRGLYYYSYKTGKLIEINELGFYNVSNLYIDGNQTLWISSDEGFAYIQPSIFENVELNSTSFYIQDVSNSDKKQIITTDGNSIFRIDYNTEAYSIEEIFTKNESLILSAIEKKDKLFVGYRDGFIDLVQNNKVTRIDLPKSNNINRLIFNLGFDSSDNLWVSQEGLKGVIKIDPSLKVIVYDSSKGLSTSLLHVKEVDYGIVYGCSEGVDSYLYQYNATSDHFTNISIPLDSIEYKDFLVNDFDFRDANDIWLATNYGLFRYQKSKIEHIPIFDELENHEIKSIAVDSENRVWLGLEYGVILYEDNNITRFDNTDGLPNLTMEYRAAVIDQYDRLWIGTAHGLAHIHKKLESVKKTPAPVIVSLMVNNEPTPYSEDEYQFGNNTIIDVSCASLVYPGNKVRYQYKINGLNNEWSKSFYNFDESFHSFPSGFYSLEIRAQKTGLLWSDPVKLEFVINKPWYFTYQMIVVYILILSGIVWLILKVRYEKSERSLAEEQIKLFFNLSSDLIFISGNNGKFLYTNPEWEKLTGFNKQELDSKLFFDLVDENDRIKTNNAISNLKETTKSINFENSIISKRLEKFHISWNISYSERHNLLFAAGRDLTERIKMENELRDVNSQKDKFFSIIAHDLRSPLTALLGYTEMLIYGDDFTESEYKEFFNIIFDSSKRISELLNNLLEWAHTQIGRDKISGEEFILAEIVNENIELLEANITNKSIRLVNDVKDNIKVFADRNMINLVLRNLMANAIKFTGNNGYLILSAAETDTEVEVKVQDSGVGLSPKDISKLFRIDVANSEIGHSEEKGTGLGLILCKEFVEKNGGKIWVESELAKGSSFYFTIPKTASKK